MQVGRRRKGARRGGREGGRADRGRAGAGRVGRNDQELHRRFSKLGYFSTLLPSAGICQIAPDTWICITALAGMAPTPVVKYPSLVACGLLRSK